MNWKQYQDETAELFRNLGCEVEIDSKIVGARAEHKIDVWVRFRKYGIETRWVIECKCWSTPVTKEKVLVLRSVVEDVGADRGILISREGFQSGALRASENTNITLTDLEELKRTAEDDLVFSVVHRLETRAIELKYTFHELYISQRTGPNSWISKPRPGMRVQDVMRVGGGLAILEFGFDRVRLKKPPYPVKFEDAGQRKIAVGTLEEFVVRASEFINEAEKVLNSQLILIAAAEHLHQPDAD